MCYVFGCSQGSRALGRLLEASSPYLPGALGLRGCARASPCPRRARLAHQHGRPARSDPRESTSPPLTRVAPPAPPVSSTQLPPAPPLPDRRALAEAALSLRPASALRRRTPPLPQTIRNPNRAQLLPPPQRVPLHQPRPLATAYPASAFHRGARQSRLRRTRTFETPLRSPRNRRLPRSRLAQWRLRPRPRPVWTA